MASRSRPTSCSLWTRGQVTERPPSGTRRAPARRPPLHLELIYAAAGLLPIGSRFEVRELGTDARVSTPDHHDRHLRPDLVLGLYVDGVLKEVWIGEIQLSHNSAKPLVISACRAALHHGVPAFSFVISPKPRIRAWMERATLVESIDAPIIPQPRDFPPLDANDARSRPHACFLRAFFHSDDLDALRLALDAARMLPTHDQHRYTAMLIQFTEMSETLRAYLRSLDEEPEPDEWDRSRTGWHWAHREGVAEGRSLGVAEGRSLGVAEGRLQAKREGLLDVLELRGIAVDEATRARVLAQTDLASLERWYARAKQVGTLDAVFSPEP